MLNIYQHTSSQESVYFSVVNIALFTGWSLCTCVWEKFLWSVHKNLLQRGYSKSPSDWIQKASIFGLTLGSAYGGGDIKWTYVWTCLDYPTMGWLPCPMESSPMETTMRGPVTLCFYWLVTLLRKAPSSPPFLLYHLYLFPTPLYPLLCLFLFLVCVHTHTQKHRHTCTVVTIKKAK